MLSFFRKNPFIGLDIQDDELRLLKFCLTHKKLYLQAFAISTLPAGAIVDGKIKQSEQVLAVLKQLVAETQSKHCAAAIALPMNSAISKHLKFPQTFSFTEIETEILENPGNYLPGIQEKIAFDFEKIKSNDEEQEILLIATRQAFLQDYLTLITAAGLKLKLVDISIHAMLRGMELYNKHHLAILNIDNATAQLIVTEQKHIIFNQLCVIDNSPDAFPRLFSLYHSMHPDSKVDSIFLTGNKILSPENISILQHTLAVKLELANPLQFIALSPQLNHEKLMYLSPRLIVSLGLGMRMLAPRSGINLLPWRKQAATQERFYNWIKPTALIVIILSIGFIFRAGMDEYLSGLKTEQSTLQTQIDSLPRATPKRTPNYSLNFHQTYQLFNLLKTFPQNIYLTKVTQRENILFLAGEINSPMQLASLIKILKQSQLFSKIILSNFSQKNSAATINFQIECHEKFNR